MNSTSLLFGLGVFALFSATAVLIGWGATKFSDWTERKRNVVCGFLGVLGLAFGIYVYISDSNLRGTTLFEVDHAWEAGEALTFRFDVEHPGVEHQLLVHPHPGSFNESAAPIALRLECMDSDGRKILAEDLQFEVREEGGRTARQNVWQSHTLRFTPDEVVTISIAVSSLDGWPPQLHLRVEDPEKRDGRRAPGY